MPARGMIRHRSTEMVYANPAAAEGFMLLTGGEELPDDGGDGVFVRTLLPDLEEGYAEVEIEAQSAYYRQIHHYVHLHGGGGARPEPLGALAAAGVEVGSEGYGEGERHLRHVGLYCRLLGPARGLRPCLGRGRT